MKIFMPFAVIVLVSVLTSPSDLASASSCNVSGTVHRNLCLAPQSSGSKQTRVSQQNTCCCETYSNTTCCGPCTAGGAGVFGCFCRR
jgi:hypothetical protein